MRFSIFASSLLMASATAQTLLRFGNGALPDCAQNCQLLQQAQSACIPPAAPVTNQATYYSCFCQSGYLISLKTTTAGVCDGVCSGNELQQVQSWYNTNCQDNGAAAAAAAAQPTAGTTGTSAGTTAASTLAGTSAPTSTRTAAAASNGQHRSWWSGHWKWVLMVIILAVAFIAIAIIGTLLKRRYDRKQDKIKSSFNAGITHRSAPMTTTAAAAAGPMPYTHDGAADATPESSAMYLPTVRERDRHSMQQTSVSNMRDYARVQRGPTPVQELGRGHQRMEKGKGRAVGADG